MVRERSETVPNEKHRLRREIDAIHKYVYK